MQGLSRVTSAGTLISSGDILIGSGELAIPGDTMVTTGTPQFAMAQEQRRREIGTIAAGVAMLAAAYMGYRAVTG